MRHDKGGASATVTTPLIVLGVILLAVVSVGGYLLGWWIKEDSTNRTSRIKQQSYARQEALVDQILDDIAEAQDPAIPDAQRAAIVSQICASAAKVTGSIALPITATTFIAQECSL